MNNDKKVNRLFYNDSRFRESMVTFRDSFSNTVKSSIDRTLTNSFIYNHDHIVNPGSGQRITKANKPFQMYNTVQPNKNKAIKAIRDSVHDEELTQLLTNPSAPRHRYYFTKDTNVSREEINAVLSEQDGDLMEELAEHKTNKKKLREQEYADRFAGGDEVEDSDERVYCAVFQENHRGK